MSVLICYRLYVFSVKSWTLALQSIFFCSLLLCFSFVLFCSVFSCRAFKHNPFIWKSHTCFPPLNGKRRGKNQLLYFMEVLESFWFVYSSGCFAAHEFQCISLKKNCLLIITLPITVAYFSIRSYVRTYNGNPSQMAQFWTQLNPRMPRNFSIDKSS